MNRNKKSTVFIAICLIVALASGVVSSASILKYHGTTKEVKKATFASAVNVEAEETEEFISDDDCMYVFKRTWYGYECKFSDFNSEYAEGDAINLTIKFNKEVQSQVGVNIDGGFSTISETGKEVTKSFIPDNDYLNIQIADLMGNESVGIVSITVDVTQKGAGTSSSSEGKGTKKYTKKGDYLLFSGEANKAYETTDSWLSYCSDDDWMTLTYDCVSKGKESWGLLQWGTSKDGKWIDGNSYAADDTNSTNEVTTTFTVRYVRKVMGLKKGDKLDSVKLAAWSDGRIKSLVLHVCSKMPRSEALMQNGVTNESWNCTDVEQFLDLDGNKYINIQYTCENENNGGWTILRWGASVDNKWKEGTKYNASKKQPTREQYASIKVSDLRNQFNIAWGNKNGPVKLNVYNDGRIIKLWISDTPVTDPGDSSKAEVSKQEGKYVSPNAAVYKAVAKAKGTSYTENKNLSKKWEQYHPKCEQSLITALESKKYIVVDYTCKKGIVPTLYIKMKDGAEKHVQAVWNNTKQAVFSYEGIKEAFENYFIPTEIDSISISTGEYGMTINRVKTVSSSTKLKEEPIGVLGSSWSNYSTEITKYNSAFKVGDKVTVKVTFDKEATASIAFNVKGKWKASKALKGKTITYTGTPGDDYVGIQLNEMPKNYGYVLIKNIEISSKGKTNYDNAVTTSGSGAAIVTSSTKTVAANAGLSDKNIKKGKKVNIDSKITTLSSANKKIATATVNEYSKKTNAKYNIYDKAVNLNLKVAGKKVNTTKKEIEFKIEKPKSLDASKYDFAVVAISNGKAVLIPDTDSRDEIITFKTTKFDTIAIVYGDKDCFKELKGDKSLHTFTKEWVGYETEFSKFNSKYTVGDTVKVTATYDKAVTGQIAMYVGGEWTTKQAKKSKTVVMEAMPTRDYLNIQVADLNGQTSVKLESIKVEITKSEADEPAIHKFTKAWDGYTTSLTKYNSNYKKGDTVKITATFDKIVNAQLALNVGGSWKSYKLKGKTITQTVKPDDDYLDIQITDMESYANVKLKEIKVEIAAEVETTTATQPEDSNALHTFTVAWDGFETTFTKYLPEFEKDKEATVVLTFDKEVGAQIGVHTQESGWYTQSGEGKTVTLKVTTSDEYLNVQITDMKGNDSVKLESITITQ